MNRVDAMIHAVGAPFSEETYMEVLKIASDIFVARQDIFFKAEPSFHPTEKEKATQELVYDFSIFGDHDIPFSEWSDIAEDGMKVLKEFLGAGVSKYQNMSSYKDLMTKLFLRLAAFMKDPRYSIQLSEWMNQ